MAPVGQLALLVVSPASYIRLGISLRWCNHQYNLLISHGEAARVTSMFYLAPPVTAIMAFAFFGERLSLIALLGMILTVLGVALVVWRGREALPGQASGTFVLYSRSPKVRAEQLFPQLPAVLALWSYFSDW